MESPSRALTLSPTPRLHSRTPSRHHHHSSSVSATSPEFEFWKLGQNPDPISPTPLHSADELFSNGFLLPLHLLPSLRKEPEELLNKSSTIHEPGTEPGPNPLITSKASSNAKTNLSASRRWKDIFKRGNNNSGTKVEELGKKSNKEKNSGGNNSVGTDLNINIWPFLRSRSAGNNSNKPAESNRKVRSAPCSRSNSSGDSKSSRRSYPTCHGRTGMYIGRASPVWEPKRISRPGIPVGVTTGNRRALKMNVPACIGYRQRMSCRSDENCTVIDVGGNGVVLETGGGSGSGLNGLRRFFSKKTVVLF